jgi:hypothetical protein
MNDEPKGIALAAGQSKAIDMFLNFPVMDMNRNAIWKDAIVAAFQQRLKAVAGFEYVPDPLPMRNSTNAIVYCLYLCFAEAGCCQDHQGYFRQVSLAPPPATDCRPASPRTNAAMRHFARSSTLWPFSHAA